MHSIDHLHNSAITTIDWTDDNKIVITDLGGIVRVLNSDLTISREWRFPTAVLYVSLAHNSLYIALANGDIQHLTSSGNTSGSISLGISVRAFAVSNSLKYIAVGSDDGEIFILNDRWQVVAKHLDGGAIQCAEFEGTNSLFACTHDGRIFRINITI